MTLSGGQQQRVAIGAALTASPRVLVLDEPTSALDPAAAEDVLAALTRLVHDLGITVLVAEHRLERVVQYADRILLLPGGGRAGRAGRARPRSWPTRRWRRRWSSWVAWPAGRRCRCRSATPAGPPGPLRQPAGRPRAARSTAADRGRRRRRRRPGPRPVVVRGLQRRLRIGGGAARRRPRAGRRPGGGGHGPQRLGQVDAAGPRWPACARRRSGTVTVGGQAPSDLAPRQAIRLVGLVPQDPVLLLNGTSVARSATTTTTTPAWRRAPPGPPSTASPAASTRPPTPATCPRASAWPWPWPWCWPPAPPVVVLDEPTRGLDYQAKDRLVALLERAGRRRAPGGAWPPTTSRWWPGWPQRVVVLAEGEVVADGPARQVVGHSPVFAPQVAKVLAPGRVADRGRGGRGPGRTVAGRPGGAGT